MEVYKFREGRKYHFAGRTEEGYEKERGQVRSGIWGLCRRSERGAGTVGQTWATYPWGMIELNLVGAQEYVIALYGAFFPTCEPHDLVIYCHITNYLET